MPLSLHSAPGLLRGLARRGANAALRLLAPDYCAACDAPLAPALVFCAECGVCPPPPEQVAAMVYVAGAYAPPLSTAILRMKFGPRADLAERLCALFPVAALPEAERPLVIPVPLHLARLAERGFNPAALLARGLSARVSGQFEPRLLERTRDTPQQSRLPASSRRANVKEAFRARSNGVKRGAAGRHALLVDDVVTTGSTLLACSQALYAAGVVHVTVVALAAAPAPA